MKNVENKVLLDQLFESINYDNREYEQRNKEIFIARYAYDMTLTAIAQEFNLSAERVRGIIIRLHRRFDNKIKNNLV